MIVRGRFKALFIVVAEHVRTRALVRLGEFASRGDARRFVALLAQLGINAVEAAPSELDTAQRGRAS